MFTKRIDNKMYILYITTLTTNPFHYHRTNYISRLQIQGSCTDLEVEASPEKSLYFRKVEGLEKFGISLMKYTSDRCI